MCNMPSNASTTRRLSNEMSAGGISGCGDMLCTIVDNKSLVSACHVSVCCSSCSPTAEMRLVGMGRTTLRVLLRWIASTGLGCTYATF